MFQESLLRLENLLMESILTETEKDKFINVFKHYSKGKWVYPGAIHRVTKIEIRKIYKTLNELEKNNFVEHYYEVFCNECKRSTGEVYKNIDNIPEIYFCDYCGNDGVAASSAVMIYKVLVQ